MQSREQADKGARLLLLSLWLVCHRSCRYTYCHTWTSQSIVCEWHQFQGLNVVIYSQYRQNFRACGGLKTRAQRAGQLDYPPPYRAPPSPHKRPSTTRVSAEPFVFLREGEAVDPTDWVIMLLHIRTYSFADVARPAGPPRPAGRNRKIGGAAAPAAAAERRSRFGRGTVSARNLCSSRSAHSCINN
jgi:hypothetical protein